MMTGHSVTGEDLPDVAHANHGRTVAAWVTTVGFTLGALIAAVGVGFAAWILAWVGAGVAAASLIAGAVLKALGHGQPRQ
jgi:hypothetical protein